MKFFPNSNSNGYHFKLKIPADFAEKTRKKNFVGVNFLDFNLKKNQDIHWRAVIEQTQKQ
jgi:hypothetical protein